MPGPSRDSGPFIGLRVVEMGDESVNYAGLLLAGLGAEVIKVEPPEGSPGRRIGPFYEDVVDPERSLFFWCNNRGKRSVVLDLERAGEVTTLSELLGAADVLLDSTERGRLPALGLAPDAWPTLVHARLSPFGDDGPWADYKTSDLVSLALGGVTMNCGYDPEPDGFYDLSPVAPQLWHSFHIAGEQLVIGVIAALIARGRSGRGQGLGGQFTRRSPRTRSST